MILKSLSIQSDIIKTALMKLAFMIKRMLSCVGVDTNIVLSIVIGLGVNGPLVSNGKCY